MSLDYYIQGFCLSALTLRPSAFYNAAGRRTAVLRGAILPSLLANASQQHGCLSVTMDQCVSDVCGLTFCNNRQ